MHLEILKNITQSLENKTPSKDNINKIIDEMILLSRNSEKTRELAELKEFLKSEPDHEVVAVFENLKDILSESKSTHSLEVKNTFLDFSLKQPPTITKAKSAPDLLNRQGCANNTYPR